MALAMNGGTKPETVALAPPAARFFGSPGGGSPEAANAPRPFGNIEPLEYSPGSQLPKPSSPLFLPVRAEEKPPAVPPLALLTSEISFERADWKPKPPPPPAAA